MKAVNWKIYNLVLQKSGWK